MEIKTLLSTQGERWVNGLPVGFFAKRTTKGFLLLLVTAVSLLSTVRQMNVQVRDSAPQSTTAQKSGKEPRPLPPLSPFDRLKSIDTWTFHAPDETLPGPSYRNRADMELKYNSTVQFIFTVGLEGTGHHLMGAIVQRSPALNFFKQRLNIWDLFVGKLQNALFSNVRTPTQKAGIWNAHCVPSADASLLENRVVTTLRQINAQADVALNGNRTTNRTISLPVNTRSASTAKAFGEVSYPNYMGSCRPLNYPDLNLFFNACQNAQVDCMIVYLYRHPLTILNSIVRRKFGGNDTSSMRIYIADLHVMANQIRAYSSKTAGCFGFFEEDPNENYWIEAQRDLWSWKNATHHAQVMEEVYQKPNHSSLTNEELLEWWLSHSKHAPYLRSWWNSHQHAIRVCREAVNGGHKINT